MKSATIRNWITLLASMVFLTLGGLVLIGTSTSAQPLLRLDLAAVSNQSDGSATNHNLMSPMSPADTATATPTCAAGWRLVNNPNLGAGPNFLRGVEALSANNVWAVGYTTTPPRRTLVEHWDGTQWSVVSSPNVGAGDNEIIAIDAISANDIWGVGYYTNTSTGLRQNLTVHWDGTQWSLVASPNALGYNLLFGVSGVSANDVWAVGLACNGDCFNGSQVNSMTMHWNGTQWSLVPSPNANWETYIWDVSAISTNDVWAVGWSNACPGCVGYTTALHWNGTAWSVVSTPNPGASTNSFYSVKAFGSNDVWATGHYYTGSQWRTLTEHWNGTQWSVVASPNVTNDNSLFGKIGATSNSDIWAVGYTGSPQQTLVLHYNGTAWSVVPSANVAGQTNNLWAVAAISANDAWAVGTAGSQPIIEHYTNNCSQATNTPAPTNTGVPPTNTPATGDAFAHFEPAGPMTVQVGSKFVLDLKINSGSSNVNAAQSYMTFTNSLIQVVNVSQPGCVLTSTATPDYTTFDVLLQNEICNGPNPCIFRGVSIAPGSIAFASGALSNPSANGDFRVARIAFCASAIGDALIHWQFSPPAPLVRNSEIIAEDGTIVSNRNLYTDYVVHVVPPSPTPTVESAYGHFAPGGPLNVNLGTTPARFTLDMMVNSGGNDVTVAQSYLTFTNSIIQNVEAGGSGCVPTNTVTSDLTTFDAQLQNDVCNSNNPCGSSPSASIAFASGALGNPAAHGDFRVAQVAFCASALGDAVIHWQFSPTAPQNRDSQVRDEANNIVSNRNLYADYVVHVTSSNVLVGHVTWQGRSAQPNASQQLPITLTLKSGATEVNYPSINTDASGFFTVSVAGLANGTYNWRVKGPKFLANGGTVSLSGAASTSAQMGLMKAGDANNDNVITSLDFNILKSSFGKGVGEIGYDARADFDGDNLVSAPDFNLLRINFGQGGTPPVNP